MNFRFDAILAEMVPKASPSSWDGFDVVPNSISVILNEPEDAEDGLLCL
jgi:hypothetical protein